MNHPFSDIDRLISLYLSRRASESEKQELEEWIHACAVNQEVFERLKNIWSMPCQDEFLSDMEMKRDQIWIAGTGQQESGRQTVDVFYWSKVAATFLIFLLVAWLFSNLIKENTATVLPPETVALVERVNPAGQRSIHMLADGTRVWLNAESSLTYPEKFADTLRLVHLRGEAFFEVAKDRQRPFIVEAAGTRVQALGTAFNIHAYPEDHVIKVALLEGKVRVQDVDQVQTAILSPGEELLAPKDNTGFSKQPFNDENTLSWKEEILIFDGVGFDSFRSAIERWYGVKVEVKGTPPDDWHIRARYQHEDLRLVLRDICFNKNIKFELHDKNVRIIF